MGGWGRGGGAHAGGGRGCTCISTHARARVCGNVSNNYLLLLLFNIFVKRWALVRQLGTLSVCLSALSRLK